MLDRRIHWVTLERERERRLHTRRRARRVEVDLTVRCSVGGRSQPRRATNLSTGGLYLRSGLLLPVGARPLLEFRIPGDDKPIRCFGQIRSQVRSLLPGMNVAFDGITGGDRIRLQRFVDLLDLPHGRAKQPDIELELSDEPAVQTAELNADFEFDAELELVADLDAVLEAELEAELEADLGADLEPVFSTESEIELELDA